VRRVESLVNVDNMGLLSKVFKKKESPKPKSYTVGKREENGFAKLYVDGKETGINILIFTHEEIERLSKVIKT